MDGLARGSIAHSQMCRSTPHLPQTPTCVCVPEGRQRHTYMHGRTAPYKWGGEVVGWSVHKTMN